MAGEAWNNQLVSLIIISAGGGFTGFFMYSPVPGPGNLITSIAPVAGVDPFGNAYPAGVTVGEAPGVQANMGVVTPGGFGIFQFLLNSGLWTNPEIVGAITGTPNFADLGFIGPASTNPAFDDSITMALNSSDAVSSSANLVTFYNSVAGPVFTYFTIDAGGVGIRAASQVTAAQPGTGTPGTPAQAETWHDLRPLTNSFVGTVAGKYPPQYRKCADGDVQIFGNIRTPPAAGNYNNLTWGTLPALYRPNKQFTAGLTMNVADGIATPLLNINSTGALQFNNMPGALAQSDLFVNIRFPLDNTGIIQS
jgi:hypothetical protein